jgi:hypothetical protein
MTTVNTYIKPSDVHSPKRHWSLIAVLFDGGEDRPKKEDRPETSCHSIAIGLWDSAPALAMRWNGNKDNPLGNPQSRGLPTWFIVPEQHWKQILESFKFSDAKIDFALNFLNSKLVYFSSHCPNPACRDYQKPALHQYRANELGTTLDKLERNELQFYHIICDGFWKPSPEEKNDLAGVLQTAWDNYRRGANGR